MLRRSVPRHSSHPAAPRVSSQPAVLLLAATVLLVACGDEQAPAVSELSLRELLGLAPERVADLPSADRRAFATRLGEAWNQQVAAEPEVIATLQLPESLRDGDAELQSPLAFVQAHDAGRAAAGLEVQVLGALDADGLEARLTQLPVPPLALGLSFEPTLHRVAAPEDAPLFAGELVYDEAWGRVEEEALEGRSQRDLVQELEPVWRRYAAQVVGLDGASLRIAPAPRAPVALWYAHAHRAVLVNPNLLYLLDPGALEAPLRASEASLHTATLALELAFIDQCVFDQQARCDACFGPNGDPDGPGCLPLLPSSTDAAAECSTLSAQGTDGIALYCYNRFLQQNLGCFMSRVVGDRCGTSGAPYADVEGLQSLRPMLTDELCQQALDECQTARLTPTVVPGNDDPPPIDRGGGGTSSAWGSACLSECFAIGCDVGASVLADALCEACAESGDESGGGGGEGCGSACEGDGLQTRRSGSTAAAGVVFALPFFFLFGVWWRGRKLEDDPLACAEVFTDTADADDP